MTPALPMITIVNAAEVEEGSPLVFQLSRTGDMSAALTVQITVTGGGGFLTNTAPTEIEFLANMATVDLSLATDDDLMGEADGVVMVTLQPDTANYELGTTTPVSGTVTDDETDLAPVITLLDVNTFTGLLDIQYSVPYASPPNQAECRRYNMNFTGSGGTPSATLMNRAHVSGNVCGDTLATGIQLDDSFFTNGTYTVTVRALRNEANQAVTNGGSAVDTYTIP